MDTETDGREKFKLFLLKELFCFHDFYGVLSKSSCSIGTTLSIAMVFILFIVKVPVLPCYTF